MVFVYFRKSVLPEVTGALSPYSIFASHRLLPLTIFLGNACFLPRSLHVYHGLRMDLKYSRDKYNRLLPRGGKLLDQVCGCSRNGRGPTRDWASESFLCGSMLQTTLLMATVGVSRCLPCYSAYAENSPLQPELDTSANI